MAACERPNVVWDIKPSPGYPGRKQKVPCGTCILCRVEQTRQNAVLILHEAKTSRTACMLTLTYDNEHLPPNGSLQWADVQKFIRKLRDAGTAFKYFGAGEYGDKTNRPHYHLCIFGQDWTENQIVTRPDPLEWTNVKLELDWGKGQIRLSPLNFSTASYAASYVQKKLGDAKPYVLLDKETGEIIQLEQPRAYRSQDLGKPWFAKYKQQVIDHDHIIINSIRQKPPKRYDEWLSEIDPQHMLEVKKRRKRIALENKKTPEEMRTRARNAHARAGRKTKSL